MNKRNSAPLIGLALLVTLFAGFGLWAQHRSNASLREENKALRQSINELSGMALENTRLSNAIMQTRASRLQANDQLRELLRLRGEINVLRQRTNELARPQRPKAVPDEEPDRTAAPSNIIPRQTWAFAGYATPEAALQSVAWAMSNGDVQAYLASLTPEGLQYVDEQLEGKPEADLATMLKDEISQTQALHLDRKRTVADGKISFVLSSNEKPDGRPNPKEEPVVVFKRVADEWRLVAAPNE